MSSLAAIAQQPLGGLHRIPTKETARRAVQYLQTLPVPGLVITAAIAYYLGSVVGLELRLRPATPSVLWPPNAVLTALLLYVPVRRWWSVLCGVAVAHFAVQLQVWPPGLVTALLLTNCSEALIAAGLIRIVSDAPTSFDTLRRTAMFIVIGGMLAPFLSSFLDASVVTFFNHEDYWNVWKLRCLSNMLAQLTVVPAIAGILNSGHNVIQWPRRMRVEVILIGAGLVLVSLAARLDIGQIGLSNMPLAPFIPLVLWAAVRFGSAGVGLSVLGTVLLTTIDTFLGEGFLPTVPSAERVRALQLFLISATVPLMCVGALIEERQVAVNALREADLLKSSILAALPDVILVLRRDGTYVDCHAKDSTQLFAPPATFIGRRVYEIMPPGLAALFADALERAAQSNHPIVVEYELPVDDARRQFEARIVRMDSDLLVSIVRDVTESKHAINLVHDLAGRLIASQEVERRRIARELHDNLTQKVALLSIGIDHLASEFSSSPEHLHELTEQASEIAAEVRNVSHELHPATVELVGLTESLRALCAEVSRKTEVPVLFAGDALPPTIDPDVSLSIYRIAQEALHNVSRHSGAEAAEVHLTHSEEMLTLQIADNGKGFRLAEQHVGLGLISMRERVAFLGGQLTIQTAPGGGTRVRVQVPLSAANHGPSAA